MHVRFWNWLTEKAQIERSVMFQTREKSQQLSWYYFFPSWNQVSNAKLPGEASQEWIASVKMSLFSPKYTPVLFVIYILYCQIVQSRKIISSRWEISGARVPFSTVPSARTQLYGELQRLQRVKVYPERLLWRGKYKPTQRARVSNIRGGKKEVRKKRTWDRGVNVCACVSERYIERE